MPAPALLITDLDGVLLDFRPDRRLQHLSALTGLPGVQIHAAIWGSSFEPEAEAGAWPTGAAYLAEFNARLGVRVSREDWVEARRRAMTTRPAVLAYFAALARVVPLALLTNNGALLRESLPELVPEVCALFGARLHASCEFGARKPDPDVYRRLLARHGVPPEAAVFVDDSPANVVGARRAGLQAVLYEDLPSLATALAAHGLRAAAPSPA